jgi:hypothetical protein
MAMAKQMVLAWDVQALHSMLRHYPLYYRPGEDHHH